MDEFQEPKPDEPGHVPYDKRNLSYANTFTNPWKSFSIKVLEWVTAKFSILMLIRKFERGGVRFGQGFWEDALGVMGIELTTPQDQLNRIPKTGPVVIVANHPHGLVDGMVLAELIGRTRTDYKILTRSLLTGVVAIDQFMIPVPFPHEDDALKKNLEMRQQAMEHLKDGGVIVLFPSGVVATSETMFGDAIEAEWNLFTAKMIHRSGAQVVPIFFQGQNSRWYQIANQISATLRQGLLLYEVRHSLNKPQAPIVGEPFDAKEIAEWSSNPRGFVAWLRQKTLDLKKQA